MEKLLPVTELLAGLAEECSELAQAALKLRRVYDKGNPTPIKEEDAIERFYEEYADVQLYIKQLSINHSYVKEIMEYKLTRWKKRMEEAK